MKERYFTLKDGKYTESDSFAMYLMPSAIIVDAVIDLGTLSLDNFSADEEGVKSKETGLFWRKEIYGSKGFKTSFESENLRILLTVEQWDCKAVLRIQVVGKVSRLYITRYEVLDSGYHGSRELNTLAKQVTRNQIDNLLNNGKITQVID